MLNEFLTTINDELTRLNIEDRESIMDFIQEMINDRLDNGEELKDILDALGDPVGIARSFLEEGEGTEERYAEPMTDKRQEFEYFRKLDIENISYSYEIIPSADGKAVLEYQDSENSHLDVRYRDGVLSIEQEWDYDLRNIFRNRKIVVNAGSSHVKIYVPEGNTPDIDLENVSGNILIRDTVFGKIELEGVSGDLSIENVTCRCLEAENVSGDIRVEDTEVSGYCALESVSGQIQTERVSCGKISAETVSGSIGMLVEGSREEYDIDISSLFNSRKMKGNGRSRLTMETVSGHVTYGFTND